MLTQKQFTLVSHHSNHATHCAEDFINIQQRKRLMLANVKRKKMKVLSQTLEDLLSNSIETATNLKLGLKTTSKDRAILFKIRELIDL